MHKEKKSFIILNSKLLQEHHVNKLKASINKRFPGRNVSFGKDTNGNLTVDPGEPVKIVKAPRKNANNFKFSENPNIGKDTRKTMVVGLSMPGAAPREK